MKRYKLLKDTLKTPAGTIFVDNGHYLKPAGAFLEDEGIEE